MANIRWALGLVVTMVATTHADSITPPAIDDAIKSAALAKKPLVVEFSATWCGPCKIFEQNVLLATEVQAALEKVMFVHYDAEVSPGLEAATRFRVDAFPTFIVIDGHGVETKRQRGMVDATAFIALLTDAKQSVTSETDIRAELKAHPNDPAVRLRAARWFAAHHRTNEAITYYAAVAKDTSALQKDRDEAMMAGDHVRRIDVWRHDLVADKVALIRADPGAIVPDDLAIAIVDSNLPPDQAHALAALVLAVSTDVGRTNTMIYIALAAGAKDEALVAAKKLVDLSRQAQFVDTLAECLHITGDRAQALHVEDDALSLAAGRTPLEATINRNRARFDTGAGDSDEVIQLHLRVAELWTRLEGADQLVARVNPSATTPQVQANMVAWKKSFDAEQTLSKSAAATCLKEAGKSELAIARLELDGAGHVTSSAVLVEDTAKPKLRACIAHELANATLPVMPGRTKRVITMAFARP